MLGRRGTHDARERPSAENGPTATSAENSPIAGNPDDANGLPRLPHAHGSVSRLSCKNAGGRVAGWGRRQFTGPGLARRGPAGWGFRGRVAGWVVFQHWVGCSICGFIRRNADSPVNRFGKDFLNWLKNP